MTLHKLSILIPAFNEEKSITLILDKILDVRFPVELRKEIIIVNDASTDSTDAQVRDYMARHPEAEIVYLQHPKNRGKGAAIRTAIDRITGSLAVVQDADLEYDPKDYWKLVEPIIAGQEVVVYGSRFLNSKNRHSYMSFYLGGRLVSWVANLLYRQRLTDEPTCYKVFDSAFLKSIPLKCERFEFCPEVTAKVAKRGIRIKEFPISYYPRKVEEGKKIKWYDGVEAIWTLLKYRFTR